MNRKFYTLMLAPLLFMACNNTTPQKVLTKEVSKATTLAPEKKVITQVQEAVVTPTITSPAVSPQTSFKYIKDASIIKKGMLHIDGFMETLKPTLKSLLQQDPSHQTAMGGCTNMAMKMTNDYNNMTNDVKIRRTALKYRNPSNQPDHVDKEVMYRLQTVNDGKSLAVDIGSNYRVYKPLQMKKPCLICHGSNISPEIKSMIIKKYPTDLATGFKLGEFRGAVVAEIQK